MRIVEIFHKGSSTRRTSKVSSKKTFRTKDSDYTLLLVTDCMDLTVETISLIYRYRWQIELFFRRLKCALGLKHLISLSKNDIYIQVYCAIIASLSITLWVGRKPTKRTLEVLCFYFINWANDRELTEHITSLKEVKQDNT